MCFDPISALASVASFAMTAAPYVATGASVLGGIQQGAAAEAAGRQAEALGEWNRQAGMVRAGERLVSSGQDAARLQTANRLRMGQARASAAASGVALEGSPLEALAFNAGQQAMDVEALLRQGEMDTRDLLAEAEMARWQGKTARVQARQQASAAYMRAGTSLLTGAGNWAKGWSGSAPAPRSGGSGMG